MYYRVFIKVIENNYTRKDNYMNYYNEIKQELINNEVYKKIKDYSKNKSDLRTYYNVGKLLSEAGRHYGESIIKKYSVRLTNELGKKYSIRSLYNMRSFYYLLQKLQAMPAELSWSHICEILPLKDINQIKYYIFICNQQNLSYRKLRERIKSREYERLDDKVKEKLIKKEEPKTEDLIKNPILIKNKFNTNDISEKMLKRLILENIEDFLPQLGDAFSFVKSEYPIKIGDRYNYIDILLFDIKDNRYVVLELKTTELKKEHYGQIKTYMNYIDKNIKTSSQNPTLGIILCKKNNKYILEYVTNDNVIERKYELV